MGNGLEAVPETIRHHVGRPGGEAVVGVFIPYNPMGVLAIHRGRHAHGHHDIQIAVPIHIGRFAMEWTDFRGHIMATKRDGFALAVLLIPDDEAGFEFLYSVFIGDRVYRDDTHEVHIAIGVEIGGPNGPGLIHVPFDEVFFPMTIGRRTVVFEPGELIPQHPAGTCHIEIAILIDIRQGHVIGAGKVFRDDMASP